MSQREVADTWKAIADRRALRIRTSQRIPVSKIRAALKLPQQFEAWLAQQPPEASVGNVYTPDDSPIANFLWDTLGIYVWVFDSIVYKRVRVVSVAYPEWVDTLLRAAFAQVESQQNGSPEITADELLTILRSAVPDT